MSRYIILVLVVVLVGIGLALMLCRPQPPERTSRTTRYIGKTVDQVIAELGQPARSYSFLMGEPLDEMRAPLLNTYPLSNPDNARIQIKEMVWQDNDYTITIWFHKVGENWVAIEGIRWHKTIRF